MRLIKTCILKQKWVMRWDWREGEFEIW
jgi:hypothetical protein